MDAITDSNGRELHQHGTRSFPCAAYQTTNDGFPWHWHEEMEIIYVDSGSVVIAAAEKRHVLEAGEGILINANVPHALLPQPGNTYHECDMVFHPRIIYGSTDSALWENYMRHFLQSAALQSIVLHRQPLWQREAAARIQNACTLQNAALPMYEFYIRAELTQICLRIWEHDEARASFKPTIGLKRAQDVKLIMSYLKEHMQYDISLKQLASLIHLSERECQRGFQSYIGLSPFQYLNQIRLARAAELLRTTQQTITEICLQCGFQSSSYFSKKFRACYGTTPHDYKKLNS